MNIVGLGMMRCFPPEQTDRGRFTCSSTVCTSTTRRKNKLYSTTHRTYLGPAIDDVGIALVVS